MAKYVQIDVTQEDIEKGVRFAGGNCPIAKALQRKFNLRPEQFSVGGYVILTVKDGELLWNSKWADWLKSSEAAKRFIKRFDQGEPVLPSRFRFLVLDPTAIEKVFENQTEGVR